MSDSNSSVGKGVAGVLAAIIAFTAGGIKSCGKKAAHETVETLKSPGTRLIMVRGAREVYKSYNPEVKRKYDQLTGFPHGCGFCHGSGTSPCYDCNGTGRYLLGVCPTCKGKRTVKCSHCRQKSRGY